MPNPQPITLDTPSGAMSALLLRSTQPRAALVLAHGAGAGMTHPFMTAVAEQLADRHVTTLRYQFPYMQQGGRRPDRPAVAQATVRAAVADATRQCSDLPLFAGGKSFGGRMTSEAQAELPLPGVRGLVFLGFPLHAANKPSIDRAEHLARVHIPSLFLQGTRDALAQTDLIAQAVGGMGDGATLHMIPDADHSFHVRARTGRTDVQVLAELCDTIAEWMTLRVQRR